MYRYLKFSPEIPAIPLFTLFLGVAIIVFFLSLENQIKNNLITFKDADKIKTLVILGAIFGAFGAAFGEAFYHRLEGKMHFLGFTFYGGFVTALISILIFCRIGKFNFLNTTNILIAPFILSHAIGRIGCFFGGCCYGKPTSCIFGVVFPEESMAYMQYGFQALHPTQLYESIALFLLYIVILRIKVKNRFPVYLILYPIIRICIECYRGDNRGILFFHALTPSKEISTLLLILGLALLGRDKILRAISNSKLKKHSTIESINSIKYN